MSLHCSSYQCKISSTERTDPVLNSETEMFPAGNLGQVLLGSAG